MNKKRFLESPVIPAMVLFILSSIWHQSLWFLNDDLAYARVPIDPALWVIRYTMWSSRLLGETVVVLLVHCPILVWQMLDACMMVLFCYLLVYHAFPRRMRGIGMWGVLILALLFPVELFKTAGWCTTTVQYLWPVTAALFAMIPWRKVAEGELVPRGLWFVSFPALLFALNFEMVLAFCAPLFVLLVVRKYRADGKLGRFLWAHVTIFGISALIIALCPGNRVRYFQEIKTWWPDYASTSLLVKGMLSLENMGLWFLFQDKLTLVFGVLAAWLVWHRSRRGIMCVIGLLPLVIKVAAIACLPGTFFFGGEAVPAFWMIDPHELPHLLSPSFHPAMRETLTLLIVASLLFFASMAAIWFILYEGRERWRLLLINLLGMGTSFSMAFSPTLFASSSRIFFVFYAVLMFLILKLLCTCILSSRWMAGEWKGDAV